MLLSFQFLHPEFLYGLSLLAIPILLHLFSLKRYKKVYFSNFNFLEALQQQKRNSSRIKNLLLLLLRLLAISCIVLAFAAPYTTPHSPKIQRADAPTVVIYADNSFSMTNTGTQGSLLEEAKKYLFDIVNTYPANTNFKLLTNENPRDILLNKEQISDALSKLKSSPFSKPLSQILKETGELTNHKPGTLFLVSDFQRKNCDFQHILNDSLQETVLLLLKPENSNNLYIRDVTFEQALHKKNQTDKIKISVANTSDKEFHNIPLSLTINNKKKDVQNIDIPAKGEQTVEINYLNTEEGFYKGLVEISDFPVVFDNKFFFTYEAGNLTEILYLWQDQENPYFGKLFSDSIYFKYTSTPVFQTPNLNLSQYDLVILDGITRSSSGLENLWEEYLTQGGHLFILPGTSSYENQNRFLQKIQAPQFSASDTNSTISGIELQSALFKDVFADEYSQSLLPHIRQFYPLRLPSSSEKLLWDKRGNTLLASANTGKGTIYISAFEFSTPNSDMVFHPLFVPLLVNMAYRLNSAQNTCYSLNSNQAVVLNKKYFTETLPVKIRNELADYEFIPEIRKNFNGDLLITNALDIPEAGLYEVIQNNRIIDVLAGNYNREESEMDFCSEAELARHFPFARIENLKTTRPDHNNQVIKEIVLQDTNKYLSPWFLLLAVLCLLLEQIVWRKKLT